MLAFKNMTRAKIYEHKGTITINRPYIKDCVQWIVANEGLVISKTCLHSLKFKVKRTL